MVARVTYECDECGKPHEREVKIPIAVGYKKGSIVITVECDAAGTYGLTLCRACIKKCIKKWLDE